MSFFHDNQDPHEGPCSHMEGLLNRTADGSAGPLAKWYALAHSARCNRCARFLAFLRRMLEGLRRTRDDEPAPEVVERLAARYREDIAKQEQS